MTKWRYLLIGLMGIGAAGMILFTTPNVLGLGWWWWMPLDVVLIAINLQMAERNIRASAKLFRKEREVR